MSFEDQSKLVPTQYKSTGFDGDLTLDYQRAQASDTELWLFQFPPQITTEDLAQSGLKIPPQTKLTAAGKNVQIGIFAVNGVRYVLSEAPADSVQNMVNFWSSEDEMENGVVFRGKPFARLFVATIDVASNLTGVRQIIDAAPMGMNKPFVAGPIKMPVGLDNPWDGGVLPNGKKKIANITKQLADAPFNFTSGNYRATMKENEKWIGDLEVYETFHEKQVVTLDRKGGKADSAKAEEGGKKDKKGQAQQQPQQQQQQQKQEIAPPQSAKKRHDQAPVDQAEIQQTSKKQKQRDNNNPQDQQLVQLGKTQPQQQPQESKKSKKDKKH